MSSRLGPRTTRAPAARRVPIATSLWPETSGATQRQQRAQVGREVDVHVADDVARRCAVHAARSARPRPFRAGRAPRRPGGRAASAAATRGVSSVLALSAMTIRHANGSCVGRACRGAGGSSSAARPARCSTGTTTSTSRQVGAARCMSAPPAARSVGVAALAVVEAARARGRGARRRGRAGARQRDGAAGHLDRGHELRCEPTRPSRMPPPAPSVSTQRTRPSATASPSHCARDLALAAGEAAERGDVRPRG